MSQARQFRDQRAADTVRDFGAVLMQHYTRVCKTREEALAEAYQAALSRLRSLAAMSRLVEGEIQEQTELLRDVETRATNRQTLDKAGLL